MSDVTDYSRAFSRAVLERVGRAASRAQERAPRPADVLESDDEYLIVVDAPGAEARDVEVSADASGVTVRIDRYREAEPGFETLFAGRGLALDADVELPGDAVPDADGTRAELRDDGTLYVYVPKAERVPIS
ncbi:MAG: Hsp20/alpha crystallin family protein [Halarchaeum sp.]